MCYRYTLQKLESIGAFVPNLPPTTSTDWQPRFNVALTSLMPVLIAETHPALREMTFGIPLPSRRPGERPARERH